MKGGNNTYGYVGGNPLNLIDPKGLEGASFGWFMGMLFDWEFGRGPDIRFFGPNSPQSADLRNLPGVDLIREEFYSKHGDKLKNSCDCSNIRYTDGKVSFGHEGFGSALSDGNWTFLFVGRFNVNITVSKDCSKLRFVARNTTSFQSYVMFGRKWVPEWERGSFSFAGNMRQFYWWDEPVR